MVGQAFQGAALLATGGVSPGILSAGQSWACCFWGTGPSLLSESVQHWLPCFPTLALPSFSVSNLAFLVFFQLSFTFRMSCCYFHLFIEWPEFKADVRGMPFLPLSFDSIPDRSHGFLMFLRNLTQNLWQPSEGFLPLVNNQHGASVPSCFLAISPMHTVGSFVSIAPFSTGEG